MFFRSPSGTSPLIGSSSLSTGRLSPVRALSARFQAGAFQQAAIGADGIARLQKDHVTHGDLSARNLEHLSIPEHFCCWSGHLPQTVQ